jgi:hypothetical protein
MINKGQFRLAERTQKDYTLSFKLQVVEEVESEMHETSIMEFIL